MSAKDFKEIRSNILFQNFKNFLFIQAVFIGLKLIGEITWSWYAVFMPTFIKLLYELVLFGSALVSMFLNCEIYEIYEDEEDLEEDAE